MAKIMSSLCRMLIAKVRVRLLNTYLNGMAYNLPERFASFERPWDFIIRHAENQLFYFKDSCLFGVVDSKLLKVKHKQQWKSDF